MAENAARAAISPIHVELDRIGGNKQLDERCISEMVKQTRMTIKTINPATPIIVGVGQNTLFWDGGSVDDAPSPQALQKAAARLALSDSGRANALTNSIDRVVVIRSNLDSVPGMPQPFGRCANPPATLADAVGIKNAQHIYSVVGGDQPQALVNEAAEDVFAGRCTAVLIAGAEALGAMKVALKRGIMLDWSGSKDGVLDERGMGDRLLSEYEIKNGLGAPTQTYPAFEHALRARLGHSRAAHIALMSELWAGFSQVAATNPYAQFPQAYSADYLGTMSAENYPVADPYLKWHVAQDAVNQGAAIILTSVGEAQRLGIDPAKWIYLHGYAAAKDKLVSERADLSRSLPIALSLASALAAAGKQASDIAHFDLYSCFPCAVLLAAEALALDWRETVPTVTGGLPFFGGPGNSYSLHAIATMAEKLRAAPDEFGLILANGGFLSKEAVGIYSARPKADWQPISSTDIQAEIDARATPALLGQSCTATVETYTVTFKKGLPARGYIFAKTDEGRILARTHSGDQAMLALLAANDMIGRVAHIAHADGVNFIEAFEL